MDNQREIKFRYILIYKGKIKIVFVTLKEIEMGKMDEYLMPKSAMFREKDKVLSRDLYTGRHDKNGKEIYKGDIVRTDFGANYQVVYSNISASFVCEDKNNKYMRWLSSYEPNTIFASGKIIEIIGNIYENLELLK